MPEKDARTTLVEQIESERKAWRKGIVGWGFVYGFLRLVAIVFSALVAAKLPPLANWVPYMAIIVAVVTTVDAWQKPQVKWRGFVGDRDDLEALLVRANDSKEDAAVINPEFQTLRRRHRENSMY